MSIDTAITSWGFAVTCTGGTAVATQVTANRVLLSGIAVTGAATTDIVTVTDLAGNFIFRGVAANISGSATLSLAKPVPVIGLKVGVAGATTGWCSIFCSI